MSESPVSSVDLSALELSQSEVDLSSTAHSLAISDESRATTAATERR